jgi:hypothetical protein
MRRSSRDRDIAEVAAWLINPGSELPGGVVVLTVRRDPVARTITVVPTGPGGPVTYSADEPVPVVRLGP